MDDVIRIVEVTKAIRWWIDRQIEDGKTNDEIEMMLPYAIAFIKGDMTFSDLLRAQANY